MQIGIIGAGNVGGALARAAAQAGHDVTITSTHPDEASEVASETGATAAPTNADAANAEIVILAVPYDAVAEILTEVGGQLAGKVVIDVTNRFQPEQLDGTSNAEAIQRQAPGASVVKAFNTVFASNQADPDVDGIKLDGYVAGDDAGAKQKVLELVESMGFKPVDAGGLLMARALEAMALLNIRLNATNEWPWQSGWKLVGATG